MYPFCCFLLCFCCCFQAAAAETIPLEPYRRQIEITGFTRAFEVRTIAAEVSGKYVFIAVDKGDTVAADGRVAEMETTFAELDLAANALARKKTRRRLALEEKNVARLQSLLREESTTQASYDEAVLAAEILKLTLAELENQKKRLEEKLERHTIGAPPGWKVVERFVDAGEYGRAAQPVVSVADYRRVRIPCFLSFEELQLLRDMDQVSVYLDDLDLHLAVAVQSVAVDFVAATGKIEVELVNIHPRHDLRGGLRARLVLAGKVEDHIFKVPAASLLSRFDAHWLVRENGDRVQVTLLGGNGGGDSVVIAAEQLSAGDRFLAEPEPAPAADGPVNQ